MLIRSIVLGLLGACAVLLAQLAERPTIVYAAPAANPATIIDVAPSVTDVIPLVGLAPGEHVIAVGDQIVTSDLAAGALIRESPRGAGRYVDVTTTQRRVIILLH